MAIYLLRRLIAGALRTLPLSVFETEVGVKYRFGRFNSARYVDYVIQEIPFSSSGLRFSDLVFPPDLLRDRYTLCGIGVPQSPHFGLMEDIEKGTPGDECAYMSRRKNGTLDARLPAEGGFGYITQRYWLRKRELLLNGAGQISVIRVSVRDEPKYVIEDGKHRAAMAAYLGRPDCLHLRLLSNAFTQDPFFQQVFSYTLGLDSGEYSINQEVIRAILDES